MFVSVFYGYHWYYFWAWNGSAYVGVGWYEESYVDASLPTAAPDAMPEGAATAVGAPPLFRLDECAPPGGPLCAGSGIPPSGPQGGPPLMIGAGPCELPFLDWPVGALSARLSAADAFARRTCRSWRAECPRCKTPPPFFEALRLLSLTPPSPPPP